MYLFNVSVSLSRALLLGEMKEKPIAHVTGIVRHRTIVEMFLTLECYNLLVFDCWHILLGSVTTTLAALKFGLKL